MPYGKVLLVMRLLPRQPGYVMTVWADASAALAMVRSVDANMLRIVMWMCECGAADVRPEDRGESRWSGGQSLLSRRPSLIPQENMPPLIGSPRDKFDVQCCVVVENSRFSSPQSPWLVRETV
jgi:hypothetical protein